MLAKEKKLSELEAQLKLLHKSTDEKSEALAQVTNERDSMKEKIKSMQQSSIEAEQQISDLRSNAKDL